MLLNNRHGQVDSDAYRYGFQGQERDDEVKGSGNSYNYTFRMHDPRLGRFFAVDPLSPEYPYYSPYQFAGNTPIQALDIEGLEPYYYFDYLTRQIYRVDLELVSSIMLAPDLSEHGLYGTPEEARESALSFERRLKGQEYVISMKASQEAASEYQRLRNPLVLAFEFSPFGAATASINDFSKGNYGWGTANAVMGFFELRGLVKGARAFRGSNWLRYGGTPRQAFTNYYIKHVARIKSYISTNTPIKINTDFIRFSQKSVNDAGEIIESLKTNGWKKVVNGKDTTIDIVKMEDGLLTTMDNTRVAAAAEAGVDVEARIHKFSDLLTPAQQQRFTNKFGAPKTWGEAIKLRIRNQSAGYRNNNPNGSWQTEVRN